LTQLLGGSVTSEGCFRCHLRDARDIALPKVNFLVPESAPSVRGNAVGDRRIETVPTCLYCRAPTTGGESAAHVLPEGVVANNVLMPAGSKCDRCNRYLGKLDSALCNHPLVAFSVQAFSLPGKERKPRKRLGYFVRAADQSEHQFSLLPEGVKAVVIAAERPTIVVEPP